MPIDLVDRLLHARRRAAVCDQLRRVPTRASVLFICHGNICRSPFAEQAFRRAVASWNGPHFQIASAGFVGPRRSAPPQAIRAAAAFGIDLSGHRSRIVTADLVRSAGLIAVMDPRMARGVHIRTGGALSGAVINLGDLDPQTPETRAIRDPWGREDEEYDRSYARIDRCIGELLAVATWLS